MAEEKQQIELDLEDEQDTEVEKLHSLKNA